MGVLGRERLRECAASVGTFLAPEVDGPLVTNGTVALTWSAATAPGSGAVDYSVTRRDVSGSTRIDACGTSPTTHVTATSCSDVPGAGTYVWQVTAYFHTWTATSAESDPASVGNPDSTPPTGVITAPAPNAIVRATTSVSSDSADADSGVASARFQQSPHGAGTWTTIGVPTPPLPTR